MEELFSSDGSARQFKYSDFEKKVLSGEWKWEDFGALDRYDKEAAMKLFLDKGIVSTEPGGHYFICYASSCNPDLALPKIGGKEVYFIDAKMSARFQDYLHTRGCLNVAKKK